MKKYLIISLAIALITQSMSADKKLQSSVFDWEKLVVKKTSLGEMRSFVSSATRSLQLFDVSEITLEPGKVTKPVTVENGTDNLIIIKEGTLGIDVNNEHKILPAGSVIVIPGGDKLILSNNEQENAGYYSITFRPYPAKNQVSNSTFEPLYINWNEVEFTPSANGGRRNIMQQKTSSLKQLEIHVTTLKEGLPSHAPHTHPDEEIILVKKGRVEQTIVGIPYRVGPGSLMFLTNDDMHGIGNAGAGECEYYAIRWLTY